MPVHIQEALGLTATLTVAFYLIVGVAWVVRVRGEASQMDRRRLWIILAATPLCVGAFLVLRESLPRSVGPFLDPAAMILFVRLGLLAPSKANKSASVEREKPMWGADSK